MTSEKKQVGLVCYQCESKVVDLSPRYRCVICEYKRSVFNEIENLRLRLRVRRLEVGLRSQIQEHMDYVPELDCRAGDLLAETMENTIYTDIKEP